ncbi:MAG: DNA-3-methyladenine glycosylase 2 family protein [Oceanospirillaceae bacterium]
MNNITSVADINADIQQLLIKDPRLKRVFAVIDTVPLRLREGGFAGIALIVVGQLLSVASANAISNRLNALVAPLTAENYLTTDAKLLLGCGLSNAKHNTLTVLAQAQTSGQLNFDALAAMSLDQALNTLCQYKGIGPWTSQVYAMFCLGHRDIFPAGDLALRKGVEQALSLTATPTVKETIAITNDWAPYRASAARLIWAYYAYLKQREGIV